MVDFRRQGAIEMRERVRRSTVLEFAETMKETTSEIIGKSSLLSGCNSSD